MPNTTTNDIDALSAFLLGQPVIGPRWHAALTSLVAERDALRKRVAELESQNPSDREVLDALMMNREAELRVVCSALAGIYSNPNRVDDPVVNGKTAAAVAKAALDALAELRPRKWRTIDPVRDLCGDPDSDLDGEALAAMRKGNMNAE